MVKLRFTINDEDGSVDSGPFERLFADRSEAYTWIREQNMHPWLYVDIISLNELPAGVQE